MSKQASYSQDELKTSSPTVRGPDEAGSEKKDLLGPGLRKTHLHGQQGSFLHVLKHPCTWRLRNLVIVSTVWLAYGLMNGALSIIGPFFPDEVSVNTTSHIQSFRG